MLFEWDMRGGSIDAAIHHFYETLYSEENENQPKPDRFMEELVRGTVASSSQIDKQIEEKSQHWRLERMPVVDRTIIRLAIYEMSMNAIPAAIVIDEALDLARQFSGEESISFINGILDAVHRQAAAAATQ